MVAPVSVICTFLNAEGTLGATLDSLHEQDLASARFILVDDGSTDQSAAIAERACAADPRFVLLANPRPGRIRALNLAVRNADAGLLAILDADDVAHPTWLSDGVAAMEKEPGFAVIGFDRLIIRDLESPDWDSAMPVAAASVADVTRRLARGNVIGHSGTLIRVASLSDVGGYDESQRYLEDYDLWVRMAKAGQSVGRSSLVRVAKRYHDDQKFGHAKHLLYASWRMQMRAALAIDPGYKSFASLAWNGLREFSREPRRALAAWALRR